LRTTVSGCYAEKVFATSSVFYSEGIFRALSHFDLKTVEIFFMVVTYNVAEFSPCLFVFDMEFNIVFCFSGGLIFMILNYAVHAFMYSYYALKAAGLKIPKIVAMVITTSQVRLPDIVCDLCYWSEDVT